MKALLELPDSPFVVGDTVVITDHPPHQTYQGTRGRVDEVCFFDGRLDLVDGKLVMKAGYWLAIVVAEDGSVILGHFSSGQVKVVTAEPLQEVRANVQT